MIIFDLPLYEYFVVFRTVTDRFSRTYRASW